MYTWENPRPVYPNELYHYGVMGMHWGIRRYQPYRKGEKVKGGHFIGQAIAKNRTTRDSYLSSFLASDYQRKADKLHEETERRKSKYDKTVDRGSSVRKRVRRMRKWENARAREADNQMRANFWKDQAKADIATAKQVNDAFKKDHPNTFRKAPASDIGSGALRWNKEHVVSTGNGSIANPVAPIWNWDRGWGHQWAVEKQKDFDYKSARRLKNASRKVNDTAEKGVAYAQKSTKALERGKIEKAKKYSEKSRKYFDQNKQEYQKYSDNEVKTHVKKYNDAQEKYIKVKNKLDKMKANGKTDTAVYKDYQRELERLDTIKGKMLDRLQQKDIGFHLRNK